MQPLRPRLLRFQQKVRAQLRGLSHSPDPRDPSHMGHMGQRRRASVINRSCVLPRWSKYREYGDAAMGLGSMPEIGAMGLDLGQGKSEQKGQKVDTQGQQEKYDFIVSHEEIKIETQSRRQENLRAIMRNQQQQAQASINPNPSGSLGPKPAPSQPWPTPSKVIKTSAGRIVANHRYKPSKNYRAVQPNNKQPEGPQGVQECHYYLVRQIQSLKQKHRDTIAGYDNQY